MIVVDLKNIKLSSINDKFGYNPKSGKLYTNADYKNFKNMLLSIMSDNIIPEIPPPYCVIISLVTYLDIDASIKVILDSLQEYGVISNDKYVETLIINKKAAPKGAGSDLKISVENIKNE